MSVEKFKEFDNLKKELGSKFEHTLYDANIELLKENEQLKEELKAVNKGLRKVLLKRKKCGDIIEGDGKGTLIECKCKACYIDETEYYVRVGGNLEDIEEIKEEKKQLKE